MSDPEREKTRAREIFGRATDGAAAVAWLKGLFALPAQWGGVYAGQTAFRPAICNWRTTEADVDLIVPTARELGARLT